MNCRNLMAITVDTGNVIYSSEDGVLFDKAQTTLIEYPAGIIGTYTIPDSVTSIGDGAFYNCDSLTTVIIGKCVTNIADDAFGYCDGLTEVYFKGDAPTLGGSYVFDGADNATVYYLSWMLGWGTTFGGRPTAVWGCTWNDNGDGTCTITDYDVGPGGTATIPDMIGNLTVTDIGYEAFRDCTGVTRVVIPNSVTSIGDWAFVSCYSLASVVIPDSRHQHRAQGVL